MCIFIVNSCPIILDGWPKATRWRKRRRRTMCEWTESCCCSSLLLLVTRVTWPICRVQQSLVHDLHSVSHCVTFVRWSSHKSDSLSVFHESAWRWSNGTTEACFWLCCVFGMRSIRRTHSSCVVLCCDSVNVDSLLTYSLSHAYQWIEPISWRLADSTCLV